MPRGILHGRRGVLEVWKWIKFVLVGSAFASVEEFLTVLVLRRDVGAYLFTLFILFPAFLTFTWLTSGLLRRIIRSGLRHELVHYFLYGLIGLSIEWFAIGLAPWSDPNADPLVMLLFQMGMFSFWATVGFAPLLFLSGAEPARQTRRSLLRFYVPYFAVTYAAAFLAPPNLKFIVVIGLIAMGYLALNVFYIQYFARRRRDAPD